MNQEIAKTIANMNFENLPENGGDLLTPSYYHNGGIDVIAFMEMKCSSEELRGFFRGNCLKYLIRFQNKGGITDLKKCLTYLEKLIALEEKRNETDSPNQ